ncbi:MAG TPA: PilZ domain-containing protein [Geomonas sp.]
MKNLSERRSNGRQTLRQAVSFELSLVESGRLDNIVEQGMGVDLSPGGMGMITQYPLKCGEVVKLLFPVTEDETRLPVFSEVMWSTSSAGEFRVGFRFLV